MKMSFSFFLILIENTFSAIPIWDFNISVQDLLNNDDKKHEYIIDERNHWYTSSNRLKKLIQKIGNEIKYKNTYTMCTKKEWCDENEIYNGEVIFESVESFYNYIDNENSKPLICPKGRYNPYEVYDSKIHEIGQYNDSWIKNTKFELKCFYHREGPFLVFYLMNGENYVLQLYNSAFYKKNKYKLGDDIKEMYDFKLMNRQKRKGETTSEGWTNPFPFMALVKKDDYLQLIATKINFDNGDDDYQNIFNNNKQLLQIKKCTQAYFNNFHFNNSFFYFTYNDIYDFTSGYSTQSVANDKYVDYSNINNVQFSNNLVSPFEFTDEVEIEEMNIMYNNNFVYYKILNKLTQKYYHGILDIKTNKIVWNTDKEIDLFIPYVQLRDASSDDKGRYEYADSMLVITRDSAYRVCPISYGGGCVYECPGETKMVLDTQGTKCVPLGETVTCDGDKRTLLPQEICIHKDQCNLTIYKMNNTHCGLCRDMESPKKYRFIEGNNCLEENILEKDGIKIYNGNLSLLVCEKGYQLVNDECIPHCYSTCKTCQDYSTDNNDQKCKDCIDGYYLVGNTNCEKIITTIITTTPTTKPTDKPTEKPTDKPTDKPTTFSPSTINEISTTILKITPTPAVSIIPTTISTTKITILPTTIIKKIPTTTVTTIPKKIPTTIIQDKCKYGVLINYTSSFSNLSNSEIYEYEIPNIINSYCLMGSSVIVKGKNSNFQVTTTKNEIREKDNKNNNITFLDLSQCESILKEQYHIDPEVELIILKFIKDDGETFQYEVYNPFTYEKLNLSYCQNSSVYVYVPVDMDEKTEQLYNNLKDQGYDPLDINDKFYREICTPYTSENGTDVLLDDREEFIYSSLANATICPAGCNYSEYASDKKYIKCECNANSTGIETLDIEHLSGKNIGNSFLSTLESTNWKVMRCYNLVFNFKIFKRNYGSMFILLLFVVYLGFMIYFLVKDITSLKVEISKILFEEEKEEKETKLFNNFGKITGEKQKEKGNYPPKKENMRNKNEHFIDEKNINTEENKLVMRKRKSKRISTRISKGNADIKIKATKKAFIGKEKQITMGNENEEQEKEEEKKVLRNLDNFELNNLEYVEACAYDKRSFCTTYWSVLMREHNALMTFFAWKDHNLFYIKIEKFFILFCVDMTMNGLFFVHETMHRKYTENEDFTFVQKIPQLLFTLVVSHILEVILCFLSLTYTHFYEIKQLPKKDKKSGEKILDIISCVQRKLNSFFVFTFILFLFFWYFISAFCAVYQNTQKIFLRDSLMSFAVSLIDPFFIYGFTTLLRCISLSQLCKKNCCCGCVFKLSDLIPIF